MKTTLYPSLDEALYLHDVLIKKFGGMSGVIDRGLLEIALARPKSGYYRSLTEQAAALMQSLALNHAFADGNKRIAFALSAVFLKINGYTLKVAAAEGVRLITEGLIVERTRWKK